MNTNYKRWQKLFLLSLGLFTGTAFCMKWTEPDFFWGGGQQFTIIGLELTNSRREIINILSDLDPGVRTILRYHLSFDFAFMAGVYPGIAALCMMARDKVKSSMLKKILFALVALQTIAWACDIAENCYLLGWISNPNIGAEFLTYHIVVYVKWALAITAALFAIPFALKRPKTVHSSKF